MNSERCALQREFKSFIRQKISGFPPTNHLAQVQNDLTQDPPKEHMHLLAKMDSSMRVSARLEGYIIGWSPLPSLTPEDPFCTRVV